MKQTVFIALILVMVIPVNCRGFNLHQKDSSNQRFNFYPAIGYFHGVGNLSTEINNYSGLSITMNTEFIANPKNRLVLSLGYDKWSNADIFPILISYKRAIDDDINTWFMTFTGGYCFGNRPEVIPDLADKNLLKDVGKPFLQFKFSLEKRIRVCKKDALYIQADLKFQSIKSYSDVYHGHFAVSSSDFVPINKWYLFLGVNLGYIIKYK